VSELDELILQIVDGWQGLLGDYDIAISTGRVVPFRAQQYLLQSPDGSPHVPLLWMHHVKPQKITWPLEENFTKPQYIERTQATLGLLVKNTNCVLLRRFSAKEETRRLVAAPFLANACSYDMIGVENHLNYLYGQHHPLSKAEAVGLSTLLNSGLIDRYFRISNGNTQVNASELRALPLPPLSVIQTIGQGWIEENETLDLDTMVLEILQEFQLVPTNFSLLRETKTV
jgi:adenine-specific DNA-methyltransferase